MRRATAWLLAAALSFGFAQMASAADMPVKAPVYKAPMVAPGYNWAGWYFGGNVGYGWGTGSDPDVTYFDGSSIGVAAYFGSGGNVMPNVRQKGMIGGLQLGYNWMMGANFVAGLVADFQASGMKASASNSVTPCVGCSPGTETNSLQTDWFGTVRAKLGWAHNNWLLYGTGGLAYGHVKSSGEWSFTTGCFCDYAGSTSTTRAGWAAGAGIDYGLMRNWIIGVEYLYVDLGHVSHTDTTTNGVAPLTTFTVSNRAAVSIARATLSYKF